jgi:NADH-quinone oxidoreductase subunit M
VEASREDLRLGPPLTAITAAVTGVIASLAVLLAAPALAPHGRLDGGAFAVLASSLALLLVRGWGVLPLIGAAAGLLMGAGLGLSAGGVALLMTLAVISIVYGACLALVQTDIKKIIAYSSISHLGYVMLGLLSLELVGIQGAIIQMVSHGLVAAGLFLLVGMIYDRCHTRDLAAYGGLARLLPVYSVFFMIFTLASVGLPTTSGFTGEFLALMGAFTAAWPAHLDGNNLPLVLSSVAVTGVVLGAMYMLRFALTFLFGAVKAPHHAPDHPLLDLSLREKSILGLLTIAVFALGLFPDGALQKTELAAKSYQSLVTTSRAPDASSAAGGVTP